MSTWSDLKNNPRLKSIYQNRGAVVRLVREFFWSRGFVETETSVAVRYPGQEPYLNPIPVAFHDPRSAAFRFYLHTSPEFAMKKLLAAGLSKIFQIVKCFRDFEDFGGIHNTEFTMIEWYRAPGDYVQIMDDTESLFKYIAERLGRKFVTYKGREISVAEPWERISMKAAWQKYLGIDLDEFLTDENMFALARKRDFEIGDRDSYEDAFYKIFLNEIEPRLGVDRPVIIFDYPAQMTSLCRMCEHDARYAERFELYIGGLELANAFGELVDAEEQARRLEHDRRKREELGKETYPVDPDFIAALRSGVPSAGGIALGVDRMVLLFTGARDLNEVVYQSVGDQLVDEKYEGISFRYKGCDV